MTAVDTNILVYAHRADSESHDHWPILRRQLLDGHVQGPAVHDARVAAICIGHGVRELLTADRDFDRFPSLRRRNPLVARS